MRKLVTVSEFLIIISEIVPENIKNACLLFCMMLLWTLIFINYKYLPHLIDMIGLYGTIYVFAGVGLLGVIIIALYLPETKGKSYEEIMYLFEH